MKRRSIFPERSISSAGRAFGEGKDEVFSGKEGVFYPVGLDLMVGDCSFL